MPTPTSHCSEATAVRNTFSILIGRVSSEDTDRILETLAMLRAQERAPPYEVVIVDRRNDRVSDVIRSHHPEVRLILCPPETSLPEMRTIALEHASGDYVVVTEDHCVPSANWLAKILETFRNAPPATVAVGGCLENGICDTAFDWATFFCEYSAFMAPIQSGPATTLPGVNITYRRSALAKLDRCVLTSGFWESTAHRLLNPSGQAFFLNNDISIVHKKRFSRSEFIRQRYLYSRYYAGLRSCNEPLIRRWMMCALNIALPPILLFRIVKNVITRRAKYGELFSALPDLTFFTLIWAGGEMVGYLRGPGDSLSKIE